MLKAAFAGLMALPSVFSFGWVAQMPGINNKELLQTHSGLVKRQTAKGCYAESCCPFTSPRVGARPFTTQFPYLGAKNGAPATRLGNIEVPTDNDVAHNFEAPGAGDIRGPCPGLNTMANHHVNHRGFLLPESCRALTLQALI